MTTGQQRLLKLAEFLETLPRRKFSLSGWVSEGAITRETPCGTVACACGWACSIPSFRRAGFRLSTNFGIYPTFGLWLGWDAVQKFFGISHDIALRLFDDLEYQKLEIGTTPKQVARRIRKYVESASAED